APFDEEMIDRFITAWYEELGRKGSAPRQSVPGLIEQLQRAVRQKDLKRLAPNPLLLTVMALVHAHKGGLPDARALLYEESVDILLWRWEQIKSGDREETAPLRRLLLEAGRNDKELMRVIGELAFEAHASGGSGKDSDELADISEHRLEKALAGLNKGDRNWAMKLVETMKLRAGLLVERTPEVFTFPHRTFQEYLAGVHLARRTNLAQKGAELAEDPGRWREVILLAVGHLIYSAADTTGPLALAAELCPEDAEDDEKSWRKAWLAGDVLREMGLHRVEDSRLGKDMLNRVRKRIADLVTRGRLASRERADAGNVLAVLGDPRDFDRLLTVPAGPFLMGSDDSDKEAQDREKPQHTLTLPEFKVCKYPVSQGQYMVFVEAGGYADQQYWLENGWESKTKHGWAGPEPKGMPFDLPNHPVVGVSWYEATAYCRWLTVVWRSEGKISRDEEARLPTEAEWEKAARGVDGRIYPWEGEFDADKCNMRETRIGATSPAGIFPNDASPYGALDMSGNVREWTCSLWGEDWGETDFPYPYTPDDERENLKAGNNVARVLRGGAYDNFRTVVRGALRHGNDRHFRYYDVGFRVFVSPISSISGL
ncbi:MAG: SUMF1/EgtB/PvdO family nonheme iron enzyme, partial [Desulfobacterales bacterium]|nr:SUMF1/EgtB/PvdO family nonheme iron enzyme [Desulfobacterales bacterium]